MCTISAKIGCGLARIKPLSHVLFSQKISGKRSSSLMILILISYHFNVIMILVVVSWKLFISDLFWPLFVIVIIICVLL